MSAKTLALVDYEREALFLQALAHPVRLAIVKFLAKGPRCGCEIEPFLSLDHSTVCRHLNTLKRAGALASHKEGVKVIYRIKDKQVLKVLHTVSTLVAQGLREDLSQLEAKMEMDHELVV